MTGSLERFAAEVGPDGPVTCVGGRTQWEVGGWPELDSREVVAPAGVVSHEPAEMITRVRAGTPLAELQASLAEKGQFVTVESARPDQSTIGGLLSVGRNGLRRLGWGPVRDVVLEVTAVSSRGDLVRSGAPLVKNVTGFDLCRLLTGSLGTLAFVAEAVLRCRPLPEVESWWKGDEVDPFEVAAGLYRPLAVLWDGQSTWVGLEGYRVDVEDQVTRVLAGRFSRVEGPPEPPGEVRTSLAPGTLRRLSQQTVPTPWMAEIGVGLLHTALGLPLDLKPSQPDQATQKLNQSVKHNFDPLGRMNPGRRLLMAGQA